MFVCSGVFDSQAENGRQAENDMQGSCISEYEGQVDAAEGDCLTLAVASAPDMTALEEAICQCKSITS